LEKLGHAHSQCLHLKMKVLIIGLFFKNMYLLDTSYCIYTLNAGITFGKQDDFT
jgi:hypothetical protein